MATLWVESGATAERRGFMRPEFIRACAEVPAQPVSYPDSEVCFGHARRLGAAVGVTHIGVSEHRLGPGQQSSRMHAHLCEDEFVLVLEGECWLRTESGEYPVRAGDVVGFPAAAGPAHCFVNRTEQAAVLLVVGEQRPGFERVYYPEDPAWMAQLPEHRRWSSGDSRLTSSPGAVTRRYELAADTGDVDSAIACLYFPHINTTDTGEHTHVEVWDEALARRALSAPSSPHQEARSQPEQVEMVSLNLALVRSSRVLVFEGGRRESRAAVYLVLHSEWGWRIQSRITRAAR